MKQEQKLECNMDCHNCQSQEKNVLSRAVCAAMFMPAMVRMLQIQVADLKSLCLQQAQQPIMLNKVVLSEMAPKTDLILNEYEEDDEEEDNKM